MSAQGNGTVKWYNPEKAYGFITTTDGHDLFVHRNSLGDDRRWLIDGQEVAFVVRQGQKGAEATDVRVTRDVEGIPPARQRLYEQSERGGYGDARHPGGYGGGRGFASHPPRPSYGGPIPSGPVAATIMRVDPSGRFLFAHAPSLGEDVYVHGTLFDAHYARPGDAVTIVIERGERGLRARSLTAD